MMKKLLLFLAAIMVLAFGSSLLANPITFASNSPPDGAELSLVSIANITDAVQNSPPAASVVDPESDIWRLYSELSIGARIGADEAVIIEDRPNSESPPSIISGQAMEYSLHITDLTASAFACANSDAGTMSMSAQYQSDVKRTNPPPTSKAMSVGIRTIQRVAERKAWATSEIVDNSSMALVTRLI
jgi:hypothetical protein